MEVEELLGHLLVRERAGNANCTETLRATQLGKPSARQIQMRLMPR